MKKYITPTIDVHNILVEDIFANSTDTSIPVIVGTEKITNGDDILSSEFNINLWEQEEEEQ